MLHDLRREIDRYLSSRSTLRQLESWLIARLQAILDSGDEELIGLANSIDADLVEFSEGLLSEVNLRRHLEAYARGAETILLDVGSGSQVMRSGARGQTLMISYIETPEPEHVTTIRLPLLHVA